MDREKIKSLMNEYYSNEIRIPNVDIQMEAVREEFNIFKDLLFKFSQKPEVVKDGLWWTTEDAMRAINSYTNPYVISSIRLRDKIALIAFMIFSIDNRRVVLPLSYKPSFKHWNEYLGFHDKFLGILSYRRAIDLTDDYIITKRNYHKSFNMLLKFMYGDPDISQAVIEKMYRFHNGKIRRKMSSEFTNEILTDGRHKIGRFIVFTISDPNGIIIVNKRKNDIFSVMPVNEYSMEFISDFIHKIINKKATESDIITIHSKLKLERYSMALDPEQAKNVQRSIINYGNYNINKSKIFIESSALMSEWLFRFNDDELVEKVYDKYSTFITEMLVK